MCVDDFKKPMRLLDTGSSVRKSLVSPLCSINGISFFSKRIVAASRWRASLFVYGVLVLLRRLTSPRRQRRELHFTSSTSWAHTPKSPGNIEGRHRQRLRVEGHDPGILVHTLAKRFAQNCG